MYSKLQYNDYDLNQWNEFASRFEFVTVAHNPSLISIIEKSFHFKSSYFFIKDNENNIVGIFPSYIVKGNIISIPHFSYGDIILDEEEQNVNNIRNEIIGSNYEIRSFSSFSKHVDASKIMCYLNLKDSEEEQWAYWKSKLRSQIRKGIKNGVEVKIGGEELLSTFYQVYSKNMHDLGSPVLGISFFKNILNLYKYGEAKIFVAYKNNINLAVGLVLTYQNFSEVCWASSLKEYNSLNANMVLYWEMIKYAVNNHYNYFSFGRSTKDSNTHRFKKQWNPNEKQLFFNYSSLPKINIRKYTFLAGMWRKLPLSFANKLGPYISSRIY